MYQTRHMAIAFLSVLLYACGGNESENNIPVENTSASLLAFDATARKLIDGVADSDRYGYEYGNNGLLDEVVFEIDGCQGTIQLDVLGYDIDRSTEVAVLLNNDEIGFLSRGRGNNKLNSGDRFDLNIPTGSVGTVKFQQTNSGEKWGVTEILVTGCESGSSSPTTTPTSEPQQPDSNNESIPDSIELTDVVDTTKYGHNYGDSISFSEASFVFTNTDNTKKLLVSGYDISRNSEISIWLNSNLIGYLSRGRKNKLNNGDQFELSTANQIAGQNTLVFRQSNPGDTWGVTNLSIVDEPVIGDGTDSDPSEGGTGVDTEVPTPTPDSSPATPAIPLSFTTNANEYGYEYGSSKHTTSASFSFDKLNHDVYLSVHGYDIDTKKEVQVELNGELIGHLTRGSNQTETEGDVFVLPVINQIAGENIVTFRQSKNEGEPWGVTKLQLLGCRYEVNGTTQSSGTPVIIDENTGTLISANFFNGGAISDGTDRTVSVCVSEKDAQGDRFAHFTTNVGLDDNTQIKAYPEFVIGSKFGLTSETSFRPFPTLTSSTGFQYPALDAVANIIGLPAFTYNLPDIDIVLDIDEQNVVGSIRDVMLESWFYDTSANPSVVGNHAIDYTDWSPYRSLPPTDTQSLPDFRAGESLQNTLNNIVGAGHPNRTEAGNILLEMMVHVGPLSPNDISGTSRNPSRFKLTDTPVTIGDYQYHIWHSATYLGPLVVYSRETNALGQPLLNLTEEGEIYLDWNLFLDYTLNELEPQLAEAGVEWALGEESIFKRMRSSYGAIGGLEFGVEPQTNNAADEPYIATVRKFEVFIKGTNFGL